MTAPQRRRIARLEARASEAQLLRSEARRLAAQADVAFRRGDLLQWLQLLVQAARSRREADEMLGREEAMSEAHAASVVAGLGLTEGQLGEVLDALNGG